MPPPTSPGEVVLSRQFDPVTPEAFQPTYESKHGSARVTPSGYVHNVYIREKVRGQGHGTKLMGKIIEHADRLGRPLSLNAREDLHPWYQRMGFQVDTSPGARVEAQIFGEPLLVRQPRR